MRLIDVDALLTTKWWDALTNDFDKRKAKIFIQSAKTIDAVEVVRCKDCEYGFDWDRDEPYDEVYCAGYCNLREADEVIVQVYSCDYCSYGKRRNDG